MSSAVNPKGSVLEDKPRTEQEPRKYQEQEKDQGLEIIAEIDLNQDFKDWKLSMCYCGKCYTI